MKTPQVKILGLANLAQLKKGSDKEGTLSREEALRKLDSGSAPAAKGYKGKTAFTRPQKSLEPTLEQVKAAIETADNLRSAKALRKLQTELTEAKAKSVKEAARRQAQLDLVIIPEAFKGKEGNLLSEAEVINRLGQPMRDHAKVVATVKAERDALNQLPSFKQKAAVEAKLRKGNPSAQLLAEARKVLAVCKQAEAEVETRLQAAYAEGDAIAATAEVAQAAAKAEYTKLLAEAATALKGESLRDVTQAYKLATQGATRHDESLTLLAAAIARIEKGERLLQTKLATGSLEELLAMYDAPETPVDTTPPVAHETDNVELAKAVAADPETLLNLIDDYFMMEEGDFFVPKPGFEEFVVDNAIFVTGEHAQLILAEYNSKKTAEIQMPPVVVPPVTDTPPAVNKKTRTKTPVKGVKVANATPKGRKSKSA